MEQVYMPLKEYYEKYLKEAKDNNFIWVLSLLSREADTKKVYQDIEEKWASINDLTNDRILFVFSARDMEQSTVLATKECSWKGYINPFLRIFGNDKIKGHEYKYDPDWVCKAPKSNLADLHSQSISDMIKFLGIGENDIPCLIFTNLLTNKKFMVRISDMFDVYKFIKEFVSYQEKMLIEYDNIMDNNSFKEFIKGYYKYLELVDELNRISNESGESIRVAIQHVLGGESYREIKGTINDKCLRENLKKYKQWNRQFYEKYIINEDYKMNDKKLRIVLQNMDNMLIKNGALEVLGKDQIDKKGTDIMNEKSSIGDMGMNQYYIFIADGWGPKYGGINTVNYNFCRALSKVVSKSEPHVVCMTIQASRADIEDAEKLGIKLISMTNQDLKDAKVLCDELIRQGIGEGREVLWIGHDVKTGEIALECKKMTGGKFVLFHHMDYEEYYWLKSPYNSDEFEIKKEKQKELCNQADAIIAIGPKLYHSALRKTDKNKVNLLIPGLEEINDGRHLENKHKAITFGRVEKENDIIKQTELAVCGYAKAYKERRKELFDTNLGYIEVIGYEEKPTQEQINILRELGNKYGECAFTINGTKYKEKREDIFNLLQDSGFCMMLSLAEGFGLVGLEAISAGLPLICSKNSGLYQFLNSEEMSMSGNVIAIDIMGNMGDGNKSNFKDSDLDSVTEAIIELLSHYDIYLSKAKALKEKWKKEFTWESAVETFLNAIK